MLRCIIGSMFNIWNASEIGKVDLAMNVVERKSGGGISGGGGISSG